MEGIRAKALNVSGMANKRNGIDLQVIREAGPREWSMVGRWKNRRAKRQELPTGWRRVR